MSILVLKNEGFCQLWGALAKKNSKKNFKRAPSASRTDPFEPLFRKKKFEKKLFLAKISLRKSPKSTTPSLTLCHARWIMRCHARNTYSVAGAFQLFLAEISMISPGFVYQMNHKCQLFLFSFEISDLSNHKAVKKGWVAEITFRSTKSSALNFPSESLIISYFYLTY